MSNPAIKTIITLFILGLSFGAGPCLASCGPLVISYIAGTKRDVVKSLIAYSLFSLSRVMVYILLALLIFFLGRFLVAHFMSTSLKFIYIAGGVFITIIGILMAAGKKLEYKHSNIMLMGVVVGLFPCAPLIAILSYIGLISKNWFQSFLYGLGFGVGTFISPLILLTVFAGLLPKFFLEKKALYTRVFSLICGLIIVLIGLQLVRRAF